MGTIDEAAEYKAAAECYESQLIAAEKKLAAVEHSLKDRDATIAHLESTLQAERDCVLRQQRELNRLRDDVKIGATE